METRERQRLTLVIQECRTNIAALEKGLHKGIITEETIKTLLNDYNNLLTITEQEMKKHDKME